MVKVIKLVSGRTSIGTQLYLVLSYRMDQIHRLTILTQASLYCPNELFRLEFSGKNKFSSLRKTALL